MRFERSKRILLRSLRYHEIKERYSRISAPFQTTFEWIYRDPRHDTVYWSNFLEWLEDGNVIYWISGKAGSGKSTLMKLIHDDPRTRQYLGKWANKRRILMSGFYFWNSGTEIQMSIEGLCQTLLHDILLSLDDETVVRNLLPERCEVLDLFGYDQEPWTTTECLKSLRRLSQPCFKSYCIFFLIDGLDEFNGDQKALLSLLQSLSQSPHIKICCASRPWVEFQDAFHQSPSLLLQHLTRPDIEKFVKTKFEKHPAMIELQTYSPKTPDVLFSEICDKSDGVFLWVVLVVESLLNGISSGDRVSDLHERLEELPEDLDALFEKIIGSMTERYKSHASQLFQMH